jgi:hypothetical protein
MFKIEASLYRKLITKLVFVFILISIIFRYYNHALLHQLLEPTIFETGMDYTYWLYQILNIDDLIVRNYNIALLFDVALFTCCVINIFLTRQRLFIFIFSILYGIYFLSYNSFVAHHTGPMDGILLITFVFWFKQYKDFKLFWEALRYFTISMLVAAFVWKVFIMNSLFNYEQAEAIVKNNLALYLFQNPSTFFANIVYFFLNNKILLQIGYSFTIVLQGLMCIGYFTKKYDWLLFCFTIIFHVSTYFFVDVCFFELWVLNFTFMNEAAINKLQFKLEKLRSHLKNAKINHSKII